MSSNTCDHQWFTVFEDHSGSGGMDDFIETVRGYYDAYMYYQCSICGKQEDERNLRAYPDKVGSGDFKTPGRLSYIALASELASRK